MDILSIDIDEWYRAAAQHQRFSEAIDRWVKQPEGWIADFPLVYGTFFNRSRNAFTEYFAVSEEVGRHLAETHRQTGETLYRVAGNFQETDAHSGSSIEATRENNS